MLSLANKKLKPAGKDSCKLVVKKKSPVKMRLLPPPRRVGLKNENEDVQKANITPLEKKQPMSTASSSSSVSKLSSSKSSSRQSSVAKVSSRTALKTPNSQLDIQAKIKLFDNKSKTIDSKPKPEKPLVKSKKNNGIQYLEKTCQTDIKGILEAESLVKNLEDMIKTLEVQLKRQEKEIMTRQQDLTSLEQMIDIRDGLCQDLQAKLNEKESQLKEKTNSLDLIKTHHELALEANESIRREYKAELECIKTKYEDEKQALINNSKEDVKNLKEKYESEKEELLDTLSKQITMKETETAAKIEHFQEKCEEQLKLSEIQYEQKIKSMQEQCDQLMYSLQKLEEKVVNYQVVLQTSNEKNLRLQSEVNDLKSTPVYSTALHDCNCENEINKLRADVTRLLDDKQKYEVSLLVTRDSVNALSSRLYASDQEIECLEKALQMMQNEKQNMLDEMDSIKNTLFNVNLERDEYKEALVNMLKSKSALVKEHNRIMEHNVAIIDSLQNVETEAYKEFGNAKDEYLSNINVLKLESDSKLDSLKSEVFESRCIAIDATRDAANAAAECSALLQQAEDRLLQLENENVALVMQLQDREDLLTELAKLRSENEQLSTTVSNQNKIIEGLCKSEKLNDVKKSPSMKSLQKLGKENSLHFMSPLKERNH